MNLGFAHPALLFGMLAAALPIIIHLINRRRAWRIPFAATYFVRLSNRRLARALKLKQFLLLLLRTLLLLLLPFLLARPYRVPDATATALVHETRPTVRILIVDTSFSMRAEHDGDTLFARAQNSARELVTSFPSTDEIAVLQAPLAQGAAAEEPSFDRFKALETIDALAPGWRVTDFSRALERARLYFAASTLDSHHLYVIGDLARTGYDTDFSMQIEDAPVSLTMLDVRDGAPIPNLAISEINAERSYFTGPGDWKVSVEVVNYSDENRTTLPLTIADETGSLADGFIDVAAGERASKSFIVKMKKAGVSRLRARLSADALEADNTRYLLLDSARTLRVLLVNGRPSTTRYKDALFYMKEALNPGGLNRSQILTRETTPDWFGREALDETDLIVLGQVPSIDPVMGETLRTFVRSGGGLFVSMGPHVDVDSYNAELQPLLPGRLRGERLAGSGTEVREGGQVVYLSALDYSHPAFGVFSDETAKSLYVAPVKHYITFDADATRKKSILARFSDGSPALVNVTYGEGNSLLFASSIDRSWNDLPIQPSFVPLMQELIHSVSGNRKGNDRRHLLVGERYSTAQKPAPEALITPDEKTIALSPLGGSDEVISEPLEQPGIYAMKALDGAVAVNLDTRESDLRPLDEASANRAFGAGRISAAGEGGLPDRRIEYAGSLLWILLLLFAGEVAVLRWMG